MKSMRTVYGLVFILTLVFLASCQEDAEVTNDFQAMDIPSAPEMNSEIYEDPGLDCKVIDFDTQNPMVPVGFITEDFMVSSEFSLLSRDSNSRVSINELSGKLIL